MVFLSLSLSLSISLSHTLSTQLPYRMAELQARSFRSVFLVTYSRANLDIIPNREAFSRCVLHAIDSTPARPIHWICSEERHRDGCIHYHMAIKLDRQQRWLAIRDEIQASDNIRVNFSDTHCNYYSAWVYATKEDDQPLTSPDHPDLTNGPPRTMAASRARTERQPKAKKQKVARLTNLDMYDIVSSKGIKTYLQLMALAKIQKDEGKCDLLQFILNKGRPTLSANVSKTCSKLTLTTFRFFSVCFFFFSFSFNHFGSFSP